MTRAPTSDVFEYTLPSLGADMDVGRVVEWMVDLGDTVRRGQIMASVETEKSDIDIEIWHDGVVEEFLVEIGEEIPVGTPIVQMRAVGGRTPTTGRPEHTEVTDVTQQFEVTEATDVHASPYARRLAKERGIDIATIHGSGPSGAIVASDVPDSVVGSVEAPDTSGVPARGTTGDRGGSRRSPESMRRLIAERMSRANREIPHYRLVRDIDLSALQDWLSQINEDRPIAQRVLPAAAYLRAVALAAARHRELNGFWLDDAFQPGAGVHVAMAISLRRGGLVTPQVDNADACSLDDTMDRLRELVAAARSGTLKSSWMTGSTITLTNLGDTGADVVHGLISPPQVALVGIGRPSDRPWVVDGALAVRPVASVTLAADHRATDGAIGSRFLATLTHALEHPEEL